MPKRAACSAMQRLPQIADVATDLLANAPQITPDSFPVSAFEQQQRESCGGGKSK
jgi:hypothetical protein